jgi:glycosyltransferase involved in cell wall biosynthesis
MNGIHRNSSDLPRDKTIAVVGNHLPRLCGIATFTTDLLEAFLQESSEHDCWAVAMNDIPAGYNYPNRVRFEVDQNKYQEYRLAADFLNMNQVDHVCLQHEYGIFGGKNGSHILDMLRNLRMPLVTTLHTVLKEPGPTEKAVLKEIVQLSDRVVVMSRLAVEFLSSLYRLDRERIVFIPHGVPDVAFIDPSYYKDHFGVEGRKVILTFGLLEPGKGLEYVIDALPRVVSAYPEVVYVVLGATHPNIKREQGEAYRISLQQRARKLRVEKHLIFHNRFVSLEELCQFLISADIYVTPYLNRERITSGTLAYAMATGKAIISTPYWYAEEMLARGRGRLVPFANASALAEQILDLLGDSVEMNAMRKRAYQFSREMVWSSVARQYLKVFEQIRQERFRIKHPRTGIEKQAPFDLPEINLNHLRRLTDETGILQHARFMIPSRMHGYTTDDNARALVVALTSQDFVSDRDLLNELICRYLGFLDYALDDQSRRFRNLLTYERTWMQRTQNEDSHARALWALGNAVSMSKEESRTGMAMDLFERALPALEDFKSPRGWAFALLGIVAYRRLFSGDRTTRRYGEMLAEQLFRLYQDNCSDEWPWIEEQVTYENGRIPQALILAGMDMGREEMIKAGLRLLRWLVQVQKDPDGHFAPVGNRGWYTRNGKKARFDQQPVEAAAMVEACLSAGAASGEEFWFEEAVCCFEWFLGRNDLQTPLYDFSTGGCCDGLDANGINQNQGAESTLSWLLALIAMNQRTAQLIAVDARTVSTHD